MQEREAAVLWRAILALLWRAGGALSEEQIASELEIDRAGLEELLLEMAAQGLISFKESGPVSGTM